jgi:hypothetical protein
MMIGARTPEDLETLLEDALLMRCDGTLADLFTEDVVLAIQHRSPARGRWEAARLALATWESDHSYVANPLRVVQSRDLVLVVSSHSINVARRNATGDWQYVIVLKCDDKEDVG